MLSMESDFSTKAGQECQTTRQKTSRDPLINDALMKASIPASRGALVAVAAQSTRRILFKPLYRGVTQSVASPTFFRETGRASRSRLSERSE
jgi:hypothetical protein